MLNPCYYKYHWKKKNGQDIYVKLFQCFVYYNYVDLTSYLLKR